jgi:hypothetical protein
MPPVCFALTPKREDASIFIFFNGSIFLTPKNRMPPIFI